MADRTTYRTTRHSPRADGQCSMWAQWVAAVRASRLDTQLAVGLTVAPGSALAARAARLTTRRHRDALARRLCRAVRDSGDTTAFGGLRSTLHPANIAAARPVIDDVVARLRAPGAVDARGIARVHRVFDDGTGPLYRFGRGDLIGRLRAALCAM